MGFIDCIFQHLSKLYDAFDIILLPGMIYLLARGRQHLKGIRFGIIVALLFMGIHIGMCGYGATGWIQERYYRPLVPLAAMLAALGYYCLAKDIKKKPVLIILGTLTLAACLVDMLNKPIREHRAPQTQAGHWLRKHDPDYRGFVISNYSQPVLYADMKYFDPRRNEKLFHELSRRGAPLKYVILDGDEEGKWYTRHVRDNSWELIYKTKERNIRIYENPAATREEKPS